MTTPVGEVNVSAFGYKRTFEDERGVEPVQGRVFESPRPLHFLSSLYDGRVHHA
ncbi:MAG: hypothetical protein HOH20_01625 [Rhodospirillaceae bacterium]|jgi:hypothetical protein|nr:hypothetical protein [Rhodospirillaceae bacterium]MBT5567001.1 hypothetical protein [Rhodospirillaceae bacterium]MBT6088252.1 hypothetical protein [Rhodospirillaceae bacterium]